MDDSNNFRLTPPPDAYHHKRVLLYGLAAMFIIIIAGGIGYLYEINITIKNSAETKSSNLGLKVSSDTQQLQPNLKIDTLAPLPPENPDINYSILLDPNNRIVIYSLHKGNPIYNYADNIPVQSSNNSQHISSSSSTVIVNGKKDKTYDNTFDLTMSPNGKRIAYVALQDGKEFVVVDGVEGKKYDYIINLKFSPDSQHIAYAAAEGKYFHPESQFQGEEMTRTTRVVLDSVEGQVYDGIVVGLNDDDPSSFAPIFSQDGNHLVYSAIRNGKNILVLDRKELSTYSGQNSPHFIGNSNDLVYIASENKKTFLVIDGQQQTSYDEIYNLFVGQDRNQIAYQAVTDAPTSQNPSNNISILNVGDLSYPLTAGGIQNLAFSKSGKVVAYYLGIWNNEDLYINGVKAGNVYSDGRTTASNPLIISPDDQLVAYLLSKRDNSANTIHIYSVKTLKQVNEIPLTGFNAIGLLKFSTDGKSLYFKGVLNRKIVFVTLSLY